MSLSTIQQLDIDINLHIIHNPSHTQRTLYPYETLIDDEIYYFEFNKILIESCEYIIGKNIGIGSYGVVYSLINMNDPSLKCFAIKFGQIETDIKVINKLNNTCNEYIVDSKYVFSKNIIKNEIKSVKVPFLIMECYNGTLSHFLRHNKIKQNTLSSNPKLLISIMINITQCINCLFLKDLYYTDIKSANLLYKKSNNDSIKIVLCDLGSAISDARGEYVSTYVPIDRYHIHSPHLIKIYSGIYTDPKESDLVWNLGVIFMDVLRINIKDLLFENIKYGYDHLYLIFRIILYRIIEDPCVKNINLMFNLFELFIKILQPQADRRISIAEILNKLNNIFVYNTDYVQCIENIMQCLENSNKNETCETQQDIKDFISNIFDNLIK
jgi:serine/threonine protein kinase